MPETQEDHARRATMMVCRDLVADSEPKRSIARRPARPDAIRRLAAFAGGSVLVIGAVAALHNLYRSGDDAAALIGWAGLLLLALTALGGGIKLAMWGARPAVTAFFDRAKDLCAEPVQAVAASGAVIVGALGMWWTFRGGYTSWWQHLTGESQWSLSLGVGQMLVAVVAGAALFNGGGYVTGLAKEALTDSGLLIERDRAAGRRRAPEGLWHPGLVAALIGGGLGLVLLTAGITPRLYVWITGPDVLPAVAAITAVLLWAIGSNLGWWKGLVGLWKWASDASQTATATAGVVAVLMFSASGLGLGWFTPATVPQARAACPPDCGGPGGSDGPPGGGQMFQPPSQGGPQMPDYQGGINQPPLDQNSGISIYNTQAPSAGNSTGSQGAQQGSQQGWDQPAHGTQIPDYQNATPYTQGPGAPNPEYNGGQANPGSQGGQPNQGVQQPAQQPQQASQQPGQDQLPQNNSGQQPNQSSDQQKIDDLTRQLQQQQQQSGQDRQRIDDLTKQLQQQKQNKQQSPKFPSKDKKKDEQDDRDKQSGDNDLSALLLGAASTRRRKQDDQQGPDTEALGQDASQAVQGLPGDVQTYVQSGQQIGESSGQAAQGFGSAAQAGASLASSAQSGAVNPQDAITVVQGVSQGIQGTADAVNAGSQIVKTAQGEADQVAQAVGDANPQLKPQTEQFTQLNDTVSKGTEGVGQVASGVSQVSGMASTFSGMGSGGLPDTSGASDLLSEGGTTVPMSGGSGTGIHQLGPAPMEPTTPTPTPPNYPEVPRTITPSPPSTNPPTTPSTSPPTPPPVSSQPPQPHLSPPVTAPGPVPETSPATPPTPAAPPSPVPSATPAPPPIELTKLRDLGYDDTQIANIEKIIKAGQGMSDQGINRNAIITALAVSLDESNYYNLPNDGSYYIPGSPIWNQWTKMAAKNPDIANGGHDPIAPGMTVERLKESLNFPGAQTYPDGHVPSDHASLGLFQQQLDMWGTMPELLNPTTSAQKFYSKLLSVPGWQNMSQLGALAQKVQGSFSDDAGSVYIRYIEDATKIADAFGVQ